MSIGRIIAAREKSCGELEVLEPGWEVRMYGEKIASFPCGSLDGADGEIFHHTHDEPFKIKQYIMPDKGGCIFSLSVSDIFLYDNGTISGVIEAGVFEPTTFLGQFTERNLPSPFGREENVILPSGISSPSELVQIAKAGHDKRLAQVEDYDIYGAKRFAGLFPEELRESASYPHDLRTYIQTIVLYGRNHLLRRRHQFVIEDLCFGQAEVIAERTSNKGYIHYDSGFGGYKYPKDAAERILGLNREKFRQLSGPLEERLKAYYDQIRQQKNKSPT